MELANTLEGTFYDSTGLPLTFAESPGQPATLLYDGVFSDLIGYNSSIYGQSGLRRTLYDQLYFGGDDGRGADVTLTTRCDLQQFCYSLLEGYEGSIIVMDAQTGALLACASRSHPNTDFLVNAIDKPSFDPETYPRWFDYYNTLPAFFLPRSTMAQDPPGSAFKLVVAACLVENGKDGFEMDDSTGVYTVGNTSISNYGGAVGSPSTSLQQALDTSSNTYFAKAVVETLGATALSNTANRFMVGTPLTLDFSTLDSRFGSACFTSREDLAQTAFGQGELAISPVHLTAIMAAVLNDGTLMTPYLIEKVQDDGVTTLQATPTPASQAMAPDTAHTLRDLLENTAQYYGLRGDNILAKTGTAETGNGLNHIYYLAGIQVGEKKYAILADRMNTDQTSVVLQDTIQTIVDYLTTLEPSSTET